MEDVVSLIRTRDSFYLGTASRDGRPYIQHRGGPPGFIRVLDQQTQAWPEFKGNRQHITAGNLSENNQPFIFLMDYSLPPRIKRWGRAEVVEDCNTLIPDIRTRPYYARTERAIRFTVEAWDENCWQYIPSLSAETELINESKNSKARIAESEAEIAKLRRLTKQ